MHNVTDSKEMTDPRTESEPSFFHQGFSPFQRVLASPPHRSDGRLMLSDGAVLLFSVNIFVSLVLLVLAGLL
jgi:hypothetical protein